MLTGGEGVSRTHSAFASDLQSDGVTSFPIFLNGAGTKDRTRGLRITSALLYQLSYTGERGQKFKRHYFRILLHRKYFISV